MKKLIILFTVILGISACGAESNVDINKEMAANPPSTDANVNEISDNERKNMMSETMKYQYSGELKDVNNGEAKGIAQATFTDNQYKLLATFENLPTLEQGFFYEGWIISKIPFNFISTGRVDRINGVYTNVYGSTKDLTDHPSYVLTKEPNDKDPAPAEHVLEGRMKKL